MIDFSKKINRENEKKVTNPIDVYDNLDRSSKTGPLRPVQEYVLKEWYDNRKDEKDLVIKLHTGEGKTLIGLLILQSKLNMGEGPCVYVCPNRFLADQAFYEAKKFGIKVCIIDEKNMFPNDFLEGRAILLTYVQKVFNGRSIFGVGNIFQRVNVWVLDDAHACLDSIKKAHTITIRRSTEKVVYERLLELFESDLRQQGEGTFIDIKENEDYESVTMIPYWAWCDKISEVISILATENEKDFIKFVWPLVRNELDKCDAYLNGKEIQIVPHAYDVKLFGSFDRAKQRILMSATTQDDIFFVKNLNVAIDAIENPIECIEKKWSGEKMLLFPSEIDDSFDREAVINYICKFEWKHFGVCALVPNFSKSNDYRNLFCQVADSSNIFNEITMRQDGLYGKTLVLVNRYDGIDLPDDACRILILDSLPRFGNMDDIYEEKGRIGCELTRRKIAQKIEQGLGRSVRGEKDYSCILVVGSDLVKFIMSVETRNYFSSQTRKQIDIGLNIVEMAKGENEKGFSMLTGLIKQSVQRDEGWKNYYRSEMDSLEREVVTSVREALLAEKESEEYFINGQYDKSVEVIQEYLDKTELEREDRCWYLQLMARRKYHSSRREAESYQRAAFEGNRQLLKPQNGVEYRRMTQINASRAQNILDMFKTFGTYDELLLNVNSWLEDLSIGVKADRFEQAVDGIGKILGYDCDRPDKLIRRGPDNLWHVGNNKYIMFECKSEVAETRECIHKSEVGQMENHCGWFEETYHDATVLRVMIITTNKLAVDANFSHDVKIMRKKNLRKLRGNILKFIKEFKNYDIQNLDENVISSALAHNYLLDSNLWDEYVENWIR